LDQARGTGEDDEEGSAPKVKHQKSLLGFLSSRRQKTNPDGTFSEVKFEAIFVIVV